MTTKIFLVLTTLTFAKSCNQADFEKPQPEGAKNLKTIPSRFQGKYESLEDSSLLQITGKSILRYKTERHSVHKNELDSAEKTMIKRDTVFYEKNMRITVRPLGDSLKITLNYTDTLVYLSDKGVIRKYGKSYFLNREISAQKWEVRKLQLNKNGLTISSTQTKEDINVLRKQLKTSDSTLVFSPTKTQFRQFIKEGGFRNQEKFRRQ
jgi:hypothetical protein